MIAMVPIDDFVTPDTAWTENQQIMFDFVTDKVLPVLNPNGVWIAPAERAPLDFAEVVAVFKAIIEHPNYEQQWLDSPDHDGFRIRFDPENRVVTITAPGGPA